ncbi:Transcription factor CBF/NF-Y/archaeal histone domain-containing protein [Plasmodiophora brassicae]
MDGGACGSDAGRMSREPCQRRAPDGRVIVREQDVTLPIFNVNRVMRSCLPSTCLVSNDAKQLVQQCVGEFIGFVTSEACEYVMVDQRKTMTGDDVLDAMGRLGFDDYRDQVHTLLLEYRLATKGTVVGSLRRGGTFRTQQNARLLAADQASAHTQ